MKEYKHLPLIAFWLLGIVWGSNFIYMKFAAALISPVQIVFLRVVFGAIPVALFALITGTIKREHLKYTHHFLFMSSLATVVYYLCYVKGVSMLYSGIAGGLSGATPLFSFILGIAFLAEEKITVWKLAGLLIGLAGIVLIAKPFEANITETTWTGVWYMVLGSLSLGGSFIYAKRFISPLKIPAAALTTYQLFGAALILCFMVDLNGITHVFEDRKAALGLIIGLGLLGTGLAYLIYYFIIEKMGAVNASAVTYIPPVVALFIGAIIVREPIAPTDYLATLLILIGVTLLRKNTAPKETKIASKRA